MILTMIEQPGKLVVLSGPSGSGKSTVINTMLEQYRQFLPPVYFSVSATTRAPRCNEQDGVQYHFTSQAEFEALRDNGGLLEWAEYAGNCYGTPRAPIQQQISAGKVVLLDIETNGALQLKRAFPDCLFVYLIPRSLSQLEARLHARGTESEADIATRMRTVDEQLQHLEMYDHIVFNDVGHIAKAAFELAAIIASQFTICENLRQYIEKE